MLIFSTKLTRGKLLTLALICACLAAILIVTLPKDDVNVVSQSLKGETNEQRIAYVESFGWEIESEPSETVNVVIPETFNDTYESYNLLQKTQGFDLTEYQGRQATRYTYNILNYPSAEPKDVSVNLIVCNDKIIGGDVSSSSLGGFMHSLTKPADSLQTIEPMSEAPTSERVGRTADEILSQLRGTDK